MAGVVYPTFVQSSKINLTASSTSLAPVLGGVAAGNVLVLQLVSESAVSTVASSVAGGGATWTLAGRQVTPGNIGALELWIGLGTTGGSTTVTATLSSSQTAGAMLMEFAGVAAFGPFGIIDTTNTFSSAGATTFNVTIAPNAMNELLIVASWSGSNQTGSPGAPWTVLAGPLHAGTNQRFAVAYQTCATVSTATATWVQANANALGIALALYANDPEGFAILNDPTAASNSAVYSPQARPEKVDIDVLQQAIGNTGVYFGCAVTPNTNSDLKFQVDAGTICSLGQFANVNAATAQAITPADVVSPRRDLVYATPSGTLVYVAGVANQIPALPQTPVNCVALGVIDVPANAVQCDNTVSPATAHVLDRRVFVRPQLLGRTVYNPGTLAQPQVSSTTFIAATGVPTVSFIAPPSGRVIYRITGGGWQVSGGGTGCVGVWESALVAGTAQVIASANSPAVSATTFDIFVSGLVPGSSHSYTTAIGLRFGGTGTMTLNIGGDVTSTASSWGPYVQEVWADG